MKTSAEVAGNRSLVFSFLSIGPEVKVTEMFFCFVFFGVELVLKDQINEAFHTADKTSRQKSKNATGRKCVYVCGGGGVSEEADGGNIFHLPDQCVCKGDCSLPEEHEVSTCTGEGSSSIIV